MATFDRGLDDEFVECLNMEYAKGGWWRAFVDDRELFVAIRDNRLNVYYHGCSLAEIWCEAGAVVGRTHYKYLLRPSVDDPYVGFVDGAYRFPEDASSLFVESPKEVKDIKRAANAYVGEEKAGVQRVIDVNPNILDVEIGFGLPRTAETRPSAPRVDFAALQVSDDGATVVFFEAKRFANRDLRAEKGRTPRVIEQIREYSALLDQNRARIVDRYRHVCRNLRCLRGVAKRRPERHALLESIAEKPLSIDAKPRLVVFGFDAAQRDGRVWKGHRQRLVEVLGRQRVLLKGKAQDIKLN
ncbi:MAG: hypothetical protein OXU42_07590 [Deltaproteobacteria bacterium]|nr:hypothetical protein [Deltaproteobacteria bacterium]